MRRQHWKRNIPNQDFEGKQDSFSTFILQFCVPPNVIMEKNLEFCKKVVDWNWGDSQQPTHDDR